MEPALLDLVVASSSGSNLILADAGNFTAPKAVDLAVHKPERTLGQVVLEATRMKYPPCETNAMVAPASLPLVDVVFFTVFYAAFERPFLDESRSG